MGTNECSQPASKSSWGSQEFGDDNMVLKMAHSHKSSRPQWVNLYTYTCVMSATVAPWTTYVIAAVVTYARRPRQRLQLNQ